jgi:cytochrome b561
VQPFFDPDPNIPPLPMSKIPSLHDQPDSFGWISIALHWVTAIAICLLWFLGNSISYLPVTEVDDRRALHIAIGLSVWALLAGRILWRFLSPHPHVRGQTELTHKIARIAHTVILATLAVMIISGPIMAWSLADNSELANIALMFHSFAATALLILVVLHVLAALKHLMFHDDETIVRIFVPRNPD